MTTVTVEADLADLDRSLRELWARAEQECADRQLARTFTQNLILVSEAVDAEPLHAAVDSLLAHHPCRVFLIEIQPGAAGLRAELTADVRTRDRCAALLLEKLTLRADWPAFERIPSLVRRHLVNDIPTAAFWAAAPPPAADAVEALQAMADRLIVDSSLFDGEGALLDTLLGAATLDLAWLRLGPWRHALAEAFEHFAWRDAVPTAVSLVHDASFGSRHATHRLAEWLAQRIGGKHALAEQAAPGALGEPCSLELRHGDVHLGIRHLHPERRLRTELTLGNHCLLPATTHAHGGDRVRLLARALDRPG